MTPPTVDLGQDPAWWARVLHPTLDKLPLGLPSDHAVAWMALTDLFQIPGDPERLPEAWGRAVAAGLPTPWLAEQALAHDRADLVAHLQRHLGPVWLGWQRSTLPAPLRPELPTAAVVRDTHRVLLSALILRDRQLELAPTLSDFVLQLPPCAATAEALQGMPLRTPRPFDGMPCVASDVRYPHDQRWHPLAIALAVAHTHAFGWDGRTKGWLENPDGPRSTPAHLLLADQAQCPEPDALNQALWAIAALVHTGTPSRRSTLLQQHELAVVRRLVKLGADPNAPFPLEHHDPDSGKRYMSYRETVGRLLSRAAVGGDAWARRLLTAVAPLLRPESWQRIGGAPTARVFQQARAPWDEEALSFLAQGSLEPAESWYVQSLRRHDHEAPLGWIHRHFGDHLPLRVAMNHAVHSGLLAEPPTPGRYVQLEGLAAVMAPEEGRVFLEQLNVLQQAPQSADAPGWHAAVAAFRLGQRVGVAPIPAPARNRL